MIDPHAAFPEVPSKVQSSANATRPVASLALYTAFLLSGCERRGMLAFQEPDDLFKMIEKSCIEQNLDMERLLKWADSLLLSPDRTFDEEELARYVPKHVGKLELRRYQLTRAAWAAYRQGSILALGCGVGKTITAIAAAIGAQRSGRCKGTRLYIFCPLNAVGAWVKYYDFLRKWFDDVQIISHDSTHKAVGLDRSAGGAMIVDEIHRLKNEDSRRSGAMTQIRAAFEWCVGLTGTLLHAGPGGVITVQDLAVPGGGRFFDPWAFGEAFDCIVKVKIGTGRRPKLKVVMPPAEKQGLFVNYMSRIVTSLSFNSPEVKDCLQLPGQTAITQNTWPEPEWVTDLRTKLVKKNDRNKVFWIPDCYGRAEVQMAAAFTEALSAELDLRDKDGLPTLADSARVQAALCREGRYDRVVTREFISEDDSVCRFVYAPGTSKDKPGFGPKFTVLSDWFAANPGEQIVIGAVGTGTVDIAERWLIERGYSYRLIRGGTPVKERIAYEAEFQEENSKVLVMLVQQEAGSESITLTNAATSVLLDHSWKATAYTQYIHRTYRIGQTRETEHYDYVFGALQEFVLQRLSRGESFDAAVRMEIEKRWMSGEGIADPTETTTI
jgi:hypothetical protein